MGDVIRLSSQPPRQRKRNRNPLTLAGNPRHQEAKRKLLLLALRRFESPCGYQADRAAKVLAALTPSDVAAIAANLGPTRSALRLAADLEDPEVSSQLGRILRVDLCEGGDPVPWRPIFRRRCARRSKTHHRKRQRLRTRRYPVDSGTPKRARATAAASNHRTDRKRKRALSIELLVCSP